MKTIMITLILTLVLSFSVAGAGLAAAPTLIGHQAGKAQTDCPIMSGKINKDLYADYQGQRVYFCCPGCIDAFKKDPEAYLKKMREQGVVPEKSPGGK